MKFNHLVKYNGVYYPIGTDVPMGDNKPVVENKVEKVEVKQEVVETPNVEDTPKYTKTEINRMPLDELKALATSNGVEGANDMTGGELKKLLIEMFNLQNIGESEYEY